MGPYTSTFRTKICANLTLFKSTDLLTNFNFRRGFGQRHTIGNLSSVTPPKGAALSLLILATQVLPQGGTLRLVCVNMQV